MTIQKKTTGIIREKEIGMSKITYAEIVLCKDCKHYRINTVYPGTNMIMTYCAKTGIAKSNPDWYCADGERRNDNA